MSKFTVLNHPGEDVRIYPEERELRRDMLSSLKELDCTFGISLHDNAIVCAHNVFDSLKEYMS